MVENQGLVKGVPHHGVPVAGLTIEEIEEIYQHQTQSSFRRGDLSS